MPQITIYLDADTERLARESATKAGEPTSRWIAEAIRSRARREWPADLARIFGSWPKDFPDTEKIREGMGADVPRENLA